MLELSSETSRYVTQWFICVNDVKIDQLLQRVVVLRGKWLEPLPGEGKSTKILVDSVEEFFDLLVLDVNLRHFKVVLHVMATLTFLGDPAFTCGTEGLDCVLFTLDHLRLISIINTRD